MTTSINVGTANLTGAGMPDLSWEREDNARGLGTASGTPQVARAFQKIGAEPDCPAP